MTINSREKRAIGLAVVVAIAIALIQVVLPLARKWSEMGTQLEEKRAFVENLREQGGNALLEKRQALVQRLGSLAGTEQAAPEAEETPAESEEKEGQEEQAAPAADGTSPPPPSDQPDAVQEAGAKPPDDAVEPDGAQAAPEEKSDGEASAPESGDVAPPEAEKSAEGADGEEAPEEDSEAGAVRLAAYIERLAAETGMTIHRVSPNKRSSKRGKTSHFTEVALQVKAEGKVDSLLKLLHGIEKGQRFARIEDIQLQRDLEKGGAVSASFEIKAYEPVLSAGRSRQAGR